MHALELTVHLHLPEGVVGVPLERVVVIMLAVLGDVHHSLKLGLVNGEEGAGADQRQHHRHQRQRVHHYQQHFRGQKAVVLVAARHSVELLEITKLNF